MRELMRGIAGSASLGSLLQLVEAEGLVARLQLANAGGVVLSDGLIMSARCGELSGYNALMSLFFLDRPDFTVSETELAPGDPLSAVTHAILDAHRLIDEWSRIGPAFLKAEPVIESSELSASTSFLMPQLNGQRSVQEIVYGIGTPPALLIDDLVMLVEQGYLTQTRLPEEPRHWPGPATLKKSAPETPPQPTAKLDFDECLESGRALLRLGRFDEAERTLMAALVLQPNDRVVMQNLRRLKQLRDEAAGGAPRWVGALGSRGS